MSQSQGSGPRSEAGLVQYFDAQESDMLFIDYRTVLGATVLFAAIIMVLGIVF